MVKQPPIAYASFVNDINHITPEGTVSESSCTALTNVTLYGFGTDPDGDMLTFNWTQVHDTSGTPLGNGDTKVDLSDDTSNSPTFTAPDLPNGIQQVDLVYQLTVNDGTINSAPSYVTVHVNNTNDPPIAMATATPAPAPEGATVILDGSGSSDPNQAANTLTYTWTQVGGTPTVKLSDAHGVMPMFVAPGVETTLSFLLTVTDHDGCSNQQPVDVKVVKNNHLPVAQAGSDFMVAEGNQACLDGSTSFDPDVGDTLSYAWSQVPAMGEPIVMLDNKFSSQPCFVTPNVGPAGATLHFHLTVTDNHGGSSTDDPPNYPNVAVNVTYVNHPPTAHASADPNPVNEGDTVHLDGSNSTDPDGNPLTYAWSQVGGNTSVNIVPDPVDPSKATFTAPRVTCAGDVVVMRLTVDDGYQDGIRTDDVNINVANTNLPTANAGGNQPAPGDPPVKEGDAVSLHGTGGDADLEEVPQLTFQWKQTSGLPLVMLSPSSGKDVSFTAPTIPGGDPNASLDLGFSLTVTDSCGGFTTTEPVTVHVANIPHAPVAVVTGPANVNEGGDSGHLNGSTSYDPDNDPITYAWTQTAGPPGVMLDDPSSPTPTFTTPWVSANTPVTFKLTVTDKYGLTNSACITVPITNWHTPPDVSHAVADMGVLWPPDHKMALVHIVNVVKPSDDKIAITGVTQDEPTNGLGDGDTAIDAVKQVNAATVDDSVLLRAERSGKGDGRVYRVCFHIADPEQSADGCATVMVPHDKKTDIAIDSGQNYNSTK
jgi:K319-like protein